MTYAQLNGWANQIANALSASGIRRGDHIALLCPNLPYFPAVYFGILKSGATVVPLNVLLKPREIAYHLRDSDAKALFCFQGTPELPMAEAAKAAVAVVPSCKQLVVLPHPTAPQAAANVLDADPGPNIVTLAPFIGGQPATFETCETSPEDTAVILYTSGTTGQPKGAELTHLNMTMNGMISAELCAGSADDNGRHATAVTLPLFHATAQTAQMLAYLHLGGTLVLLPRFDPPCCSASWRLTRHALGRCRRCAGRC
jgi:long-chain acyl-CoA synthetase